MNHLHERAARYLQQLPPSIQGSGGSAALFKAAVCLVKGFALPAEEALPLLLQWNQSHGQPPWSEAELRYKLKSATGAHKPDGYLLQARDDLPEWRDAETRKVWLRQQWPAFRLLEPEEMEAIARLRNLPLPAVRAAAKWHYLWHAQVDGHPCFMIGEDRFVQARRLDGRPLDLGDGRQPKAKNLPGSQGAFIGRRWLNDRPGRILLVEGAIGLIEALAAHELVGPDSDWSLLAATSASSRFARDPELLQQLAGYHVRILPDPDQAGLNGAASWFADLEQAGCKVEVKTLPEGFKDLGPLVANPDQHLPILTALFQ